MRLHQEVTVPELSENFAMQHFTANDEYEDDYLSHDDFAANGKPRGKRSKTDGREKHRQANNGIYSSKHVRANEAKRASQKVRTSKRT